MRSSNKYCFFQNTLISGPLYMKFFVTCRPVPFAMPLIINYSLDFFDHVSNFYFQLKASVLKIKDSRFRNYLI